MNGNMALILMYHRVADIHCDPWSLCVTPQHFAEHLEILRKYTRPIRLRELTGVHRDCIPFESVVVTFDDGYADNLHNARPLLDRYDIPATAFITTGYVGQAQEFWWDELERLLLEPGTLPDSLRLRINGGSRQWQLSGGTHYDEHAYRQYRKWRAWEDAPTPRQSLYYSLWQLLQPLLEDQRRHVLDELMAWAPASAEARPAYRTLSPHDVVALSRGELVEVGAHTVTHPLLPALPVKLQWTEIEQSKTCLESILGRPVTSFAYPYGAWSDETVAIVRQAGFVRGCSTRSAAADQNTDDFQLPRVQVHDWDGEEFGRQLATWFDRSREQRPQDT